MVFMNKKILKIEAILDGSCLKIGIHQDESIWTYEKRTISIEQIDHKSCQLIEMINDVQRQKQLVSNDVFTQIRNEGRLLGDELLTPELKYRLNETSNENLIIRMDDNLVQIPWELICIQHHFLCELFNVGREVRTRQHTGHRRERKLNNPLQMWIISDPYDQLAKTIEEGNKICSCIDRANKNEILIDALHQSQIMHDEINERIRNYDIIHFAGHVDYHSDHAEDCGWHLSSGIYKACDILKLSASANMPSLVFSNACHSARTDAWNTNNRYKDNMISSYGLANAFMLAGVKHYIGNTCEIVDAHGSEFAYYFYQSLIAGKSVGESVRQARSAIIETNPHDIGWASYILYGDPSFCYVRNVQKDNTQSIEISNNSDTNTTSPPKSLRSRWPGASVNTMKIYKTLLLMLLAGMIFFFYCWETERQIPKDIIKSIEKNTIQKQQRIKRLFDEYIRFLDDKSIDSWSRGKLSIYVELDQSKSHFDTDLMIIPAIQKKLMNLDIVLVERETFDHILAEKIRMMQQGGDRQQLLMPDLALIVFIHHYQKKQFFGSKQEYVLVSMRLVDINRGVIVDIMDERFVKDQSYQMISHHQFNGLVKKIKEIQKKYPIRGLVFKVDQNIILMNIGDQHGVQINQHFKTMDNSLLFNVISVQSNSCELSPLSNANTIHAGLKLIEAD